MRAVDVSVHFKGIAAPGDTEFAPLPGDLVSTDGRLMMIFRGFTVFFEEPYKHLKIAQFHCGSRGAVSTWADDMINTKESDYRLHTVQPGERFAITVRNFSDAPLPFACEIRGKTVR